MKQKQNLHTHTTWCDGIDTPEEMVQIALEKGFTGLGFSGHSTNPYSIYAHVTDAATEQYKREVLQLKDKYRGQLDIFLGLEVDYCCESDLTGYDYLIGSVHYLKVGQEMVGFDRSAETVKSILNTYFSGDGMAFAKAYFETLAQPGEGREFDIIGHFDIFTKNIEALRFLDMNDKVYLDLAIGAMEALQGKIPLFELNTGGIARGYRTAPYPAANLLKELQRLGFGAVITSDCHNGAYLDHWFTEAEEYLRSCGFRGVYMLTENGFVPEGI